MKRRSFLVSTSAVVLSQLISGCNQGQQTALKVRLLKNSIPPQLFDEFRKVLKSPVQLNFGAEDKLEKIFGNLKAWKQQAGKKDSRIRLPLPFIGDKTPELANVVTLGDYWLTQAVEQKLIQPLDIQQLAGWKQLPPAWQEIVMRDEQGQLRDEKGKLKKDRKVWGAPYRWGTTVIVYRQDKFKELGWMPKDWSDLWRPELRDRISLLDQPREVIGLTLKKLGRSYNTQNLSQVPNLKEELLKLHQQVKYYSSDRYLEPLIWGDTWLALGWSSDVLSVQSTHRQISAVVPLSGTALWADVWVQPASLATGSNSGGTSASPTPPADTNASLVKQWIEFCWQSQPAREISVLSNATSPILTDVAPGNLPPDLQTNRLLLPERSILNKSEFLHPLPQATSNEYLALWKEIRTSKISGSKTLP